MVTRQRLESAALDGLEDEPMAETLFFESTAFSELPTKPHREIITVPSVLRIATSFFAEYLYSRSLMQAWRFYLNANFHKSGIGP